MLNASSAPRILVVDDEEPILVAMQEYFSRHGCEVQCARELEEAEALISRNEYAAIIADLRLTGVYGSEGLSLVGFVRERSPKTPMILLTAYGSPQVEKEAHRLRVDRFLNKPVPLSQLAQIVFDLMRRNS